MRRLLLATDGSPAADEALDFAISFSREVGAELHVVVVRPSPGLDAAEARAAVHVADAAVQAAARRGVRAIAHVGRGDAGREIAAAAARLGASMIVIGARPRRAKLGSVSRSVTLRSPVPVTVVRARAA
jgi:nucleotide-binding universal stress UspA family protein